MKRGYVNRVTAMHRLQDLLDRIALKWWLTGDRYDGKIKVHFELKRDFEKEFEGTYKRPENHMFI